MTDFPSSPESAQLILAHWRNRFPSNGYTWPGRPEDWAIEAVKALSAELAQTPQDALVKALEAERDYWAEGVSDAAADLQEGCPFTDAVRDRIAFCSERAERINRVLSNTSTDREGK